MKFNTPIYFTGIVTILIWTHLAWDYYHGGVPTHYLLHSKDMPGFSNWWGGIALPLVTWFLLYRIQKRINDNNRSGVTENKVTPIYKFIAALVFGIATSILFTLGSDLPGYMMIGLIVVSFFTPLYQAEYLLGFIIGMVITFGTILPIIFSVLDAIIFAIGYKLVRTGVLYLAAKL